MKRLVLAAFLAASPVAAFSATWSDVPLIDHNCADRYKGDPDKHATSCLLQCAGSGFGIVDHGKWTKLDATGNEKAVAALKATTKKDHVRVNVSGERKGNVIHVSSLDIAS